MKKKRTAPIDFESALRLRSSVELTMMNWGACGWRIGSRNWGKNAVWPRRNWPTRLNNPSWNFSLGKPRYGNYSLTTLEKVAAALGARLKIELEDTSKAA